jgi:hypothetical protein
MKGSRAKVAVYPGGRASAPPGREIQELWFALAKNPWTSVALVPADEGTSTAEIATSLADVGKRLRETPVTAILAESLDYDSARALADLEQHVERIRQRALVVDVTASVAAVGAAPAGNGDGARPSGPIVLAPAGQVIVAVQSVVQQPLGIAVARAADAVVLCVEMGHTRIAAAKRTIELIGRERIAGCVLVHRGAE